MTTIVVPLDGTPFAERALRPACSLAARLEGGRVLLLGCSGHDGDVTQELLDDRVARFADVVRVETRLVQDDDPADATLVTVESEPDAMACLASHGRGAVPAAVLGSVAEQVVHRSTRPLVLVGPHCRTALLPGERGRLLVCSDGSLFSDSIIPAAAAWAARLALEPWLVEVVPPDENQTPADQPARNRQIEAAAAHLTELCSDLGTPTCAAHTEVLPGTPSRAIAQFAEELPAALIAMATHGRTGLSHVTLGSVATDVVRHAHCPVLLARPPVDSNEGDTSE